MIERLDSVDNEMFFSLFLISLLNKSKQREEDLLVRNFVFQTDNNVALFVFVSFRFY